MEDSVVIWGFIVIVVYGAAARWFIKGLKAERKAKREKYWSHW